MNEEPKSIWKKSWKGPRALLFWLTLILITLFVGAFILMLIGVEWLKIWNGQTLIFAIVFALGSFTVIVAAVFLFYPLICWFFRWRNFKRFLFGLACFVTLIALFYAEEDWRGWHAWSNFKHAWEAKGEHFDFASVVPPPVPDDQNFAMAPIWAESVKAALGGNARHWKYPDDGRTNFTDRMPVPWHNCDSTHAPTGGDWTMGSITDLKSWQAYYRTSTEVKLSSRKSVTTNEFPIAPQPQTPAKDVLLALSKYDSTIEELRQASRLSYSRFPLNYDSEDPAVILLPHLSLLKRSALVLELRAIAELQNGQSEKALDDVKLALRLADSVRTEPFIITHLVRIAIVQITLQPVWEGLAEHQWSDAQLAAFDAELAKLDFLADYEFSVRSERAAHVKIVDWMEQKRSRFWELFNMVDGDERNMMNHFGVSLEIYLMPRGWYYQSEIVLSQVQQQWVLPMVNDPQQTVSPQAARESVATVGSLRPTAVNLFARLLLPALGKYAERTAYGQTEANLARAAIALERHRLAHGEFPESLDALAPQFMEKIPHDAIGGPPSQSSGAASQPLHYRRTDDGQFVLYSVGWNEVDDGGTVGLKKDGSVDIDQGDWVWRYPQK